VLRNGPNQMRTRLIEVVALNKGNHVRTNIEENIGLISSIISLFEEKIYLKNKDYD
jgi:hypothetical protein